MDERKAPKQVTIHTDISNIVDEFMSKMICAHANTFNLEDVKSYYHVTRIILSKCQIHKRYGIIVGDQKRKIITCSTISKNKHLTS
jgi:hypothetical protein